MTFRRVGEQRDILGESPVWDAQAQALFWVDIRRPALRRLDPDGTVQTRAMPDLVGALALAGYGRLLVAVGAEVAVYDWATGGWDTVAALPDRPPGHRFNDGRCDRQGRFWVGTMHNLTRAPEGTLFRLDCATLTPVRTSICIPNSLAWSPDGSTMYFADSLDHTIEACPYADGIPGASRDLAHIDPPGFPDGATVDADGYLWSAQFNAGRLVRYAPDGRVDQIVPTPVGRPTSCGFGGPALQTLYVTTTSQAMSDEELRDNPLAGALLAFEPGVPGLPEPMWQPA